jgi:16S rRNA (cytidine1402-2'-O)-methyltransferase
MTEKIYHVGAQPIAATSLTPGLYLVSTPIGNLGDMTLRSLNALAAADVIYCEDTRITPRLLERFGIKNRIKPYHDHNSEGAGAAIIAAIAQGQVVAVVSDAGTPLISDPGFPLVRDCLAAGLTVEALPGASALLPALQLSGLPTDRFAFLGFLPQKRAERIKVLKEIDQRTETVVVYESPHRIVDALDDMAEVLEARPLSVSREITKLHEETLRGSAASIVEILKARPSIRGEFVVVIGAQDKAAAAVSDAEIMSSIEAALVSHPPGKAASIVSKALGLPRDEIYARILLIKDQA